MSESKKKEGRIIKEGREAPPPEGPEPPTPDRKKKAK